MRRGASLPDGLSKVMSRQFWADLNCREEFMLGKFLGIMVLSIIAAPVWPAGAPWVEGQHYVLIDQSQVSSTPDAAAAITEIFSYGCPFCAQFSPTAKQLKANLPAQAQFAYLPAAFIPSEDWPMFQRAYCTAQLLGIADQTHDAIFDAVWKTGELAVSDPATHRLKKPAPTIEDAARVYSRLTGISADTFLGTAHSFAVDAKMHAADDFIQAYGIQSTPSIVVYGKYRVNMDSVRTTQELIDLVKWLVAKGPK
jgi:thiol:disulfide interchange protein DsbA